MQLQGVVIAPLLAGAAALVLHRDGPRRALLLCTAVLHLGLVGGFWLGLPAPEWDGLLELDALGLLFLSLASLLFLAASVYGLRYLAQEKAGLRKDFRPGILFSNAPEARFTACLLFFLAAMSLVCATRHVGLLWVGIEATTLSSAPLIYFHRQRYSLEATWKYLLICSVGIALALLGNILLCVAVQTPEGLEAPMRVSELVLAAGAIDPVWFKAAFIFVLVGYGTKMGLAPMHTWLPDAHSESPSLVSALLSGALLNCAFLGILRVFEVGQAVGLGGFASELLVGFGLLSMAVAAAFILGQGDFKRILAYSSVEHMGVMALGVGLGGAAIYGSLLHALNHSLTKAMLFFLAGNVMAAYRTKSTHDVHGLLRVLPVSGVLWTAGFLAIVGSPPFGLFVSEFTILKAALDTGRPLLAAGYLALLAVAFLGMIQALLRTTQGDPPPAAGKVERREHVLSVAPPLAFGLGVALLGVFIPEPIQALLLKAAQLLAAPGAH